MPVGGGPGGRAMSAFGTATLLTLTSLFPVGCGAALKPDPAAPGWILWSMRFSGSSYWAQGKFETRDECAVEWPRRADDAARRGLRAYYDVNSLTFTMREKPHDTSFMAFVCMDARRDPTRP